MKHKVEQHTSLQPMTMVYSLGVLGVVFALLALYYNWGFFQDDSYISLRYVANLLNGDGMTWNPGERVEGYTNFLWIILVTLVAALGVDIELASKLLGIAFYIASIEVFRRFCIQQCQNCQHEEKQNIALVVTVPTVVLATSFPLILWSVAGLEVNLFTFLIMGAVMCVILLLQQIEKEAPLNKTHAIAAGLLFAAAALTRPDGLLFAGVSGLFLLVFCVQKKMLFSHVKPQVGFYMLTYFGLALLVIIVPYALWKYHYFGDILPNTYYVKAYGFGSEIKAHLFDKGYKYYLLYFLIPPWVPLATIAGGALYLSRKKLWRPHSLYLIILFVVFSAYVIKVGGDFMPHHRFLVPTIPLTALLLFLILKELLKASRISHIKNISVLISVAIFICFAGINKDQKYSSGALGGHLLADHIKEHWPEGSTIAINTVGALPYLANTNYYIDMLGLTDKHIAKRKIDKFYDVSNRFTDHLVGHLKGDGAYVLKRQPDYIVFDHLAGVEAQYAAYLSGWELNNMSEFHKHYAKRQVWVEVDEALHEQVHKMIRGLQKTEAKRKKLESGKMPRVPVFKDGKILFTYYQHVNASKK